MRQATLSSLVFSFRLPGPTHVHASQTRRANRRRLSCESLESRQLFAADTLLVTDTSLVPEDVNSEGIVSSSDALMIINRTTTDASGVYHFDSINETGDYSVRIVSDSQWVSLSDNSHDFLVSNGAARIRGLDFRLRRS